MSTLCVIGENRKLRRPLGRLRWGLPESTPFDPTISYTTLKKYSHTCTKIYERDVYFGNVTAKEKNMGIVK